MSDKLCSRLGDASLEMVALAIENFAEGDPPDVADAEATLSEMSELLLEAQEVISRLKAGTLTRDEARTMIVTEDEVEDLELLYEIPETRRDWT